MQDEQSLPFCHVNNSPDAFEGRWGGGGGVGDNGCWMSKIYNYSSFWTICEGRRHLRRFHDHEQANSWNGIRAFMSLSCTNSCLLRKHSCANPPSPTSPWLSLISASRDYIPPIYPILPSMPMPCSRISWTQNDLTSTSHVVISAYYVHHIGSHGISSVFHAFIPKSHEFNSSSHSVFPGYQVLTPFSHTQLLTLFQTDKPAIHTS